MSDKKFFTSFLTIFLLSGFVFSANNISLLENAKTSGMTIYYDSLSQSGMIEKNGHQLSFRNGEQIVILDSIRMMITDAPEIKNNQLFVSQKFIDDSKKQADKKANKEEKLKKKKKKKKYHVHIETENASFLKMYKIMQSLGIEMHRNSIRVLIGI